MHTRPPRWRSAPGALGAWAATVGTAITRTEVVTTLALQTPPPRAMKPS